MRTAPLVLAACWFFAFETTRAGDPAAVRETLRELSGNWPGALFSIDVRGTSSGEATLGRSIEVEYEAAVPGYLTIVHVKSHGDIALVRGVQEAKAFGAVQISVEPPLGTDRIYVLFSSAPLATLFDGNENSKAMGADRSSATALVSQLKGLQNGHVQIASRRYEYEVVAPAGGTEYTTRGITYRVLNARTETPESNERFRCPNSHSATTGPAGTMIPAHFEFNSDQLTRQEKLDLDVFGEVLSSTLKESGVVLQGNTDAVGTDDYNIGLSQRRAAAVKRYLEESFAIAPARIRTVGMGRSNPVAPNDTDSNRACNRRVDFVISTPRSPNH